MKFLVLMERAQHMFNESAGPFLGSGDVSDAIYDLKNR
jgi:hypothetical protein